MLKVENLTFRYSKFSRPVLNGASLELHPGEIGILALTLLAVVFCWAKTAPEKPPCSRTSWVSTSPAAARSSLRGKIC